jgi:GAF domain-containing protein
MAAIRRAPVWSADIAAHPLPGYDDAALDDGRLLAAVVATNAYRAVLAIPVMSRETVLGAICLYWNAIHEPTAREIRVLTAFAQQAAVALENARLFASLEERLTRQQTLTRLTRLISGSLDTPTVLAEISRAAARILDSPLALFWVVDRERMTLQFSESSDSVLAADFPLRQVRFDEGVVGWIAAHRQPLAVADVFTDSRFRAHDWWRRHGLKSFYGLPVMLEGVLLAVLTFNSRQPFELTPADQDILDSFVAQAALAIHNATLFEDEARARREVELALAQVKQLQGMLPICALLQEDPERRQLLGDDRGLYRRALGGDLQPRHLSGLPGQGGGTGDGALEAKSARPLRHTPQGPHRVTSPGPALSDGTGERKVRRPRKVREVRNGGRRIPSIGDPDPLTVVAVTAELVPAVRVGHDPPVPVPSIAISIPIHGAVVVPVPSVHRLRAVVHLDRARAHELVEDREGGQPQGHVGGSVVVGASRRGGEHDDHGQGEREGDGECDESTHVLASFPLPVGRCQPPRYLRVARPGGVLDPDRRLPDQKVKVHALMRLEHMVQE